MLNFSKIEALEVLLAVDVVCWVVVGVVVGAGATVVGVVTTVGSISAGW